MDFASDAHVISQLSTDRDAVAQAVMASPDPSGWTHISKGLEVGLSVLEGDGHRDGARKVLLLLTDGEQSEHFCLTPDNSCPSTCYSASGVGYNCDFWASHGYACNVLESTYGCDCSGESLASCPAPETCPATQARL